MSEEPEASSQPLPPATAVRGNPSALWLVLPCCILALAAGAALARLIPALRGGGDGSGEDGKPLAAQRRDEARQGGSGGEGKNAAGKNEPQRGRAAAHRVRRG